MTKIFINGYFLAAGSNTGGVNRFSLQLLLALDKIVTDKAKSELKLILVIPKKCVCTIPKLKSIQVYLAGVFSNKYLWEQFDLPRITRKCFLINLANYAPLFKREQITVIHDTLVFRFPRAYSKKFVLLTKMMHHIIIKNSKYIATVSNFSKQEIYTNIGKPQNEILVLANSAEQFAKLASDNSILAKYNLLAEKYILAVFSQQNSEYKNVQRYLEAIKNINFTFVCVGGLAKNITNNTNLLHIGSVSDNELKALYENAYAFIFPSLYEGFGIPPLEAMTCGCPVLASDIEVLHEVCGHAADYFNPLDVDEIKAKIEEILGNTKLRKELIASGYVQARKYSWLDIANNLLRFIEG